MQNKRHRIQFPQIDTQDLNQDEAYFFVSGPELARKRIRFHDYNEIYRIPGLYEELFYDRLKCVSPTKVAEILHSAIEQAGERHTGLRVLDLGAGNGLMGEALKKYGVSRLVGTDIIPEAHAATERDRPHVYDAYYVADFCELEEDEQDELDSWNFNCLTTVAALGFGDIPPEAFVQAFNLLPSDGWVAFNIKEHFLNGGDDTGFSSLVRELILSQHLDIYHLERYRHRLSIEGEPLYYFAIAAKKTADIPPEMLKQAA